MERGGLASREAAGLPASEEPMPIPGDQVVTPVEPGGGQQPEDRDGPPRPAEGSQDEQSRQSLHPTRPVLPLVIRDHADGRQPGVRAAEGLHVPRRGGPLKRRKAEAAPGVAGEHELHESVAETAGAVVENQVRAAGRGARGFSGGGGHDAL